MIATRPGRRRSLRLMAAREARAGRRAFRLGLAEAVVESERLIVATQVAIRSLQDFIEWLAKPEERPGSIEAERYAADRHPEWSPFERDVFVRLVLSITAGES